MIKVMHIINGLETGGAELALSRLLSFSDRSCFEMQVISLVGDGPVGDIIRAAGIRVHCLGMSRNFPDVPELIRLVRLLRQQKPDVVQTWLQQSDLLGGIAAKLAGVAPVLWNIRHSTMHTSYIKRKTRAITHICAWLSGMLPTRIVCCSERSKEEQRKIGYADYKLIVIPNGIDTGRFTIDLGARSDVRNELQVQPDTILIGASGRFHPQKDYRNFIRAAQKICVACPTAVFAMCGDNVRLSNPEIACWVADTGFADRFRVLGRRNDMPRFMAGLDIFVSTSAFGEGFPNVVAEAMACGVPCVVTDVGDSARIVGTTGKVVSPEAPAALADACLQLIGFGSGYLRKCGADARDRIVTNFSMQRMESQYEHLYRQAATA
jgi:glycosyltransferase involved in cell wall biosynthesis